MSLSPTMGYYSEILEPESDIGADYWSGNPFTADLSSLITSTNTAGYIFNSTFGRIWRGEVTDNTFTDLGEQSKGLVGIHWIRWVVQGWTTGRGAEVDLQIKLEDRTNTAYYADNITLTNTEQKFKSKRYFYKSGVEPTGVNWISSDIDDLRLSIQSGALLAGEVQLVRHAYIIVGLTPMYYDDDRIIVHKGVVNRYGAPDDPEGDGGPGGPAPPPPGG